MKNYAIVLIAAIFGLVLNAQAQSSKEVLDKLSAKAKDYKTMSADFTSTLDNPKAGVKQSSEGSIKIKGSKYVVNMGDYRIWCDGKTVWNYSKVDNSVTIDDIEDTKDGGFDPSEIFTIWEKDFKHEMKNASASIGGASVYEIALYPNDPKKKAYHTILLYINKAKMEVAAVKVKTRENATIEYKIKNLKTNTDIADSEFTFTKSKFPGVEVVDNRI